MITDEPGNMANRLPRRCEKLPKADDDPTDVNRVKSVHIHCCRLAERRELHEDAVRH